MTMGENSIPVEQLKTIAYDRLGLSNSFRFDYIFLMAGTNDLNDVLTKWKYEDPEIRRDFRHVEDVHSAVVKAASQIARIFDPIRKLVYCGPGVPASFNRRKYK